MRKFKPFSILRKDESPEQAPPMQQKRAVVSDVDVAKVNARKKRPKIYVLDGMKDFGTWIVISVLAMVLMAVACYFLSEYGFYSFCGGLLQGIPMFLGYYYYHRSLKNMDERNDGVVIATLSVVFFSTVALCIVLRIIYVHCYL